MDLFKIVAEVVGGFFLIPMIIGMSVVAYGLIIVGLWVGITDKIRQLTGNEIIIKGGTKDVKKDEE